MILNTSCDPMWVWGLSWYLDEVTASCYHPLVMDC